MKSKKIRNITEMHGNSPGTDTDDTYLPVCCGEFGLEQAANLRELWEATWPQDRRGRDESAKGAIPSGSRVKTRKTEEGSSEE